MPRLPRLIVAFLVLIACDDEGPLEPLSEFPFALATPSCGPTDAPIVSIYLATQAFESSQPVAPYVQVQLLESEADLHAGDVFEIRALFTEANAWFHGSGVETRAANRGEVGVTSFTNSTLSGYVDVEFPGGSTFRGSFVAAWQPRQMLCG